MVKGKGFVPEIAIFLEYFADTPPQIPAFRGIPRDNTQQVWGAFRKAVRGPEWEGR